MPNRKIAIAIDGPAASGKSSTAKAVARELHFRHVDSGALYRAATAATLRAESNSNNWTEDAVLDAAKTVSLSPTETGFTPLLDGADADSEMRGEPVTSRVSLVAQMPRVREWVNAQVRNANESFDVVVDGRDIGTVVFPDASLNVFLVADPAERARRPLIERLNRAPTNEEVAQETGKIMLRDEMDAKQSGRAPDATLIDTTYLTQAEQIRQIVEMARKIRDAS
jgi:cytidylate kinase